MCAEICTRMFIGALLLLIIATFLIKVSLSNIMDEYIVLCKRMLFGFGNRWINMELSVMCQPGWQWGLGENGYMCVAESLCCSPETITTLLTGYTLIQKKKFKVQGKQAKK